MSGNGKQLFGQEERVLVKLSKARSGKHTHILYLSRGIITSGMQKGGLTNARSHKGRSVKAKLY